MAFQSSKTNLLYIAGRAQRKIEENTDKKILTVYDTDFAFTTTDLSRELVNKIDASYGLIRLDTQVSLCDEFYSVRTEDIECQPECVYCNCPPSGSSTSTTCGLEAPYEITCSCFDNTINGCEHTMTLNFTQSCCDGTGETVKTGKPCFKTFNSTRSGIKAIPSPPIWYVPFDNNSGPVGSFKRPSLISGDRHVVSFARKYENLDALLDPNTTEPYPELIAWGDGTNDLKIPKLCNPSSSSSGQFCPCTEGDSDLKFTPQPTVEPNVAISAVGDTTFLAHKDKNDPTKLKIKSFGKTNFDFEFKQGDSIRIDAMDSIVGFYEGSIKGIKHNGRDVTTAISSNGRFLVSLNDASMFNNVNNANYGNPGNTLKYEITPIKNGTGSALKIQSGINLLVFSEIIGTKSDNMVLNGYPKQIVQSGSETINGQQIYKSDYDMAFGSIFEPIPVGGTAVINLSNFRTKVVDISGSFNKGKQVYDLQIARNNTMAGMTLKGQYPTGSLDTPEIQTNNSNKIDSAFKSTLADNTIPGKTSKKIGANTTFKMSDSGLFSVLVTNEGKALVSTVTGMPTFEFNIPSDMVFDPRYIAVTDDSITLVESNCSYKQSNYLTGAAVYTYADIKSAANNSSFILSDKTDTEDTLRATNQYILIMRHIFGPTSGVQFKIGTKKSTGSFEWLEKILKVSDSKKHIKIYLSAAEATQLLNKISVYAYTGEATNPTAYDIFTTKIDCSTSPSVSSSSSSTVCRRIDGSISSSSSSSNSGSISTTSSTESTSSSTSSGLSSSAESSSSSSDSGGGSGAGMPVGLMYAFGIDSGKCPSGDFTFNNVCIKCLSWGINDLAECYDQYINYITTNPKSRILSQWGECKHCSTICDNYELVDTIVRTCCKNTTQETCGTDRVCISKNYCDWLTEGFNDADCPENYKLIQENYSVLSGEEYSNYYINCCHTSDPNEPFGVCGESCGGSGCNPG